MSNTLDQTIRRKAELVKDRLNAAIREAAVDVVVNANKSIKLKKDDCVVSNHGTAVRVASTRISSPLVGEVSISTNQDKLKDGHKRYTVLIKDDKRRLIGTKEVVVNELIEEPKEAKKEVKKESEKDK